MELLPFVDILKVFNNPISEEQAWAVCYQCAHFLYRNPTQGFYQDVFDSGINSIWISRHGDVLLRKGKGLQEPNGSGKGPPHTPQKQNSLERRHSNTSIVPCRTSRSGVIATESDAVQALGMAIFEALDYGIDATEERQLSAGLESLIASMTQTEDGAEEAGEYYDAASQNADDEGIEKDAGDETEHTSCTIEDVLKLCRQHLSSKQDSNHHFKAVCRALATEAGELFTFLDKISSGREKLTETADEDAKRLEELQRADWACLWVQVMRSLRQGVLLKKIEHVHQPPLEYELTPFEMILEDIRSRRYTLHKIMVNGEIPHQVKNDAHEVILNFIRSRPPLKRVHERKLKPKPQPAPDPHELLLQDIRAKPKLRPIREGKLVVETPRSGPHHSQSYRDEPETSAPVKRIIKADLNLLLDNSSDESSEEDTLDMSTPSLSSSSAASTPSPHKDPLAWRRAATMSQDLSNVQQRPSKLQRRHTIMVCEAPVEGKVAQELPPLAEEEDEPSPIKESHSLASLHSRLRPNPSYTNTSQQQHQSYQHFQLQQLPQQQFYHHPSFQKTSYSDHDIQNPSQVTLRHPQGSSTLKRRSSMEHRRSLTSLPTGLCAIPEMEDSGGSGTDGSPGSQRPSPLARRSWSSEQAPPPNPSPPIKARVRAGVGTGMNNNGSMSMPSSVTGTGSRLSRSASLPSSTLQTQLSSAQTNSSSKARQQKHSSSSHSISSIYSSSGSTSSTHSISNKQSMQSYDSVDSSSIPTQRTASKFSSSHVPPPSSLSMCVSSSEPITLEDYNKNKHVSSSSSSSSSQFTSKNSKNPQCPSPSSRAKHLSTASIFLTGPSKSSSSSPTSSSSANTPQSPPSTPTSLHPVPASRLLTKGGKLDSSVSSQSPAYVKQHSTPTPAPRTLHQQEPVAAQQHTVIEPTPHRQATSPPSPTQQQSRWRHPNALEERRTRRQQGNVSNEQQSSSPLSPRKPTSSSLSSPTHHRHSSHQDIVISAEPSSPTSVPSRRLSLDGGVHRYSTTDTKSSTARWREGLQTNSTRSSTIDNSGSNIDKGSTSTTGIRPVPNRRMSLGERGQRQAEKESQEEIERISRWRALQNEDMENRVARKPVRITTNIVPVMRSPSSGAFDIRGKVSGTRNSLDLDEGSKSFSSRYQQLKQQYQSEQHRNGEEDDRNGHLDSTAHTAGSSQKMNTDSTSSKTTTGVNQQHQQQQLQQQQLQQQHHKTGISASGRRLLYESQEALQQHMATEEARLARWRQLEEAGGAIVERGKVRGGGRGSTAVDFNAIPSDFNDLSQSDLEYVSDGGSGRHACSPELNPVPSTANRYNSYNNHPVGPRADNTTITNTTTIPPVDDDSHHPATTSSTQANDPPSDIATTPSHYVMPKRWENPVECLSLTLEEVTHIRSVLTMAELESLISHPDLYQMVSKSKLCFTCKTTRFSLFGEWGTKCKFCKRTVCSKCLRKMTVPSDHFRNIPVYTLSPTPLSQEVLEFIQNFVRKVPNTSSFPGPSSNTKKQPNPPSAALRQPLALPSSISSSASSRQKDNNHDKSTTGTANPKTTSPTNPNKPLLRSQSVLVPGQKSQNITQSATGTTGGSKSTSLSRSASVSKGQLMAICCDCKGMIMEIIRASKTSLALISAPGTDGGTETPQGSSASSSVNVLPTLTELSSSSEYQQNSGDFSSS